MSICLLENGCNVFVVSRNIGGNEDMQELRNETAYASICIPVMSAIRQPLLRW
jgi:hypothetical protein